MWLGIDDEMPRTSQVIRGKVPREHGQRPPQGHPRHRVVAGFKDKADRGKVGMGGGIVALRAGSYPGARGTEGALSRTAGRKPLVTLA